jgi:opacity protein-like surface antigen
LEENMTRTATAAVALSLALGITSAGAATLDGLYAGADIGVGTLKYEVPGTDLSGDDGGVAYGVFGGWRTNFNGNWIGGAEARLGDTDSDINAGGLTLSSGREWSVSGLLGYQLNPRWMLFGTLGYDNLKLRAHSGPATATDTLDGIRLSLGAEYALTEQISLRGSLDGSAYGNETIAGARFDDITMGRASIAALYRF